MKYHIVKPTQDKTRLCSFLIVEYYYHEESYRRLYVYKCI